MAIKLSDNNEEQDKQHIQHIQQFLSSNNFVEEYEKIMHEGIEETKNTSIASNDTGDKIT